MGFNELIDLNLVGFGKWVSNGLEDKGPNGFK